jgi:DNA-binding Lrp family transcriptional regulator
MITAFIMMQMERDAISAAAEEMLEMPGITEVYSVAGEWDLVAVARVKQNEDLAKLVTEDMIEIEGVVATQTLIAFRQYSKHDLERMFGLE